MCVLSIKVLTRKKSVNFFNDSRIYISIYLSHSVHFNLLQSVHYICMHISMYVSMYVCTYVSIYLSIFISIYYNQFIIYVCIYQCMYVYLSINLSIYLSIYIYIYIYIYACMYVCNYLSVEVQSFYFTNYSVVQIFPIEFSISKFKISNHSRKLFIIHSTHKDKQIISNRS